MIFQPGAFLRLADDVPGAVDAAAVAHRVALQHPRRRVRALPWRAAVPRRAWVLLLLAGWRPRSSFTQLPVRLILVAGPVLFILIAAFTTVTGRHFLEYPPQQAGLLISILEAAATLSIGITLVALFMGERPHDEDER